MFPMLSSAEVHEYYVRYIMYVNYSISYLGIGRGEDIGGNTKQ